MAPNAAVIAPHHFVSVLMCSGLNFGKVFAVPESDLIYRRNKLDIGAHVLVRQHDGSRRRKGVIVHMYPHINARVPPAAPLPAASLAARPPRQRPAKRPREPEQPNPAIGGSDLPVPAKRFKPGPSQPITLPGYSFLQPLVLPQFDPIARLAVSNRYPGRDRVRKQLTYSRRSSSMRSVYASFNAEPEELDADNPTEPMEEPQPAYPPTTPFQDDLFPLHPAPFSRSLLADHPHISNEFSEIRNEQHSRSRRRDAEKLQYYMEEMEESIRSLGCGLRCNSDCLAMSPRLG